MRLLSVVLLVSMVISPGYPSPEQQRVSASVKPAAAKLELKIVSTKTRYKLTEQLKMMVMLSMSALTRKCRNLDSAGWVSQGRAGVRSGASLVRR